jgi:hypothetical protein
MKKIFVVFSVLLAVHIAHSKTIDDESGVVDLSLSTTISSKNSPAGTASTEVEIPNKISSDKPPKLGIMGYFKERIRNCLKRKLKLVERIPEFF